MSAPKTRRRVRKPPVHKYVFSILPPDDAGPLAIPAQASAWATCPEKALRSIAADVPIGWQIIPAHPHP
jgi:hypothetical protein